MRHFITTQDWPLNDLRAVLDDARRLKKSPIAETLRGKYVALLFLNPSLRTRTSFQIGVHQLGGMAVVLEPGGGSWPIEFESGKLMDGDAEEHIQEVARVLSRYCDVIAIRAFPGFRDWALDRTDHVIRSVARYATVPVVNMETITHPCQEMAHIMTLEERLGDLAGRNYLLTWTWHPKPLNTAVANSALLIATRFGMDVTLLIPDDAWLLDDQFMDAAQRNALENGRKLTVTHDIESAYDGAEVVYCKSWGALPFYGNPAAEWTLRDRYRHFIVDSAKMSRTAGALFSHCLPLRRNIKATDEVMDADWCVAIDEAENRLHVQKAILRHVVRPPE